MRQTFRERRRALSTAQQKEAALTLVEQFKQHELFANAQHIAIYLTNDGELDTQALIQYFWEREIAVYLPVLHPFSDGHLLFLRYTPDSAMRPNAYGILEPQLDCRQICPLRDLDVLFTPLVAFDEGGNRLGMGGGFYDRTLAFSAITKSESGDVKRPIIVGLAHDIQKCLSLPTQAWDIPLPYILTPTKLYQFTDHK
uniref:5-formyltetrahydrofolate cyclo-ligase n=1 Tax=Ningiella ruwaisensis TaxID=2364274 RepID=UPI00109FCD74|nr:5-formyltetrahydrofolate cyclo-ligase [Ningiella ruwaisensis]